MLHTIRFGGRLRSLATFLTLTVSGVYAQTLPVSGRCAVTSVPTQVRSEGITEQMGDIILQCSGNTPGAALTGKLSVALPVNITNRIDANTNNLTHDAVLYVDYGSGFVPTGVNGQISNTLIAFNGLNLTIPSSGNLNLKISNIRAAVATLGTQTTLSSPPIQAQLIFSNPTSIQINQSFIVVAYPQTGLFATLYDKGITCTGSPLPDSFTLSNLFNAGTTFVSTRVTEGFATSFLPRGPGEDNGTRFLIKYSGFPSNTHLYLPDAIAGSDATVPSTAGDLGGGTQIGQYTPGSKTLLLVRVLNTDPTGAGGFLASIPSGAGPVTLNSVSEVQLNGGSGVAVYEVIDANNAKQESVQFPTFIGLSNVTAPAVAQETISFAPTSSTYTASTFAPVPRFVATVPPSDCSLLGDCSAGYFPHLSVLTTPAIALTAVSGGDQTSLEGYLPVNNSGGGIMNWFATVAYQNGSGWLNLSLTSGQNFGSIIVTASGKGLAPGTYNATININAGSAGSFSEPVTLTVTPAPAATVVVSKVVNPATFAQTPLVAGSLGTIMGTHLKGGNVSVTFDGAPATLLYNSDTQINLQVPLSVASKTSANMIVTVDGTSSAPQQVALAPAWPSVFPGAILNQDNSVNGAKAAAAAGSVLQIFATGIPAGATVTAQIAGHNDLVPLYAGSAPTLTGVQQVNVTVPSDVSGVTTQLVLCAAVGGQQYCSAASPLTVQ